ncbi:hypothetical protein Zmor_010456 [Zophobas morio]|uniref:CCHC-type domain-containing protein n=2 Tax=Zophobas morio TaxID=2755281 RepID=A0AA38MJZ3_9CUCU|nr:hypothetical protein Zmor_020148 [Zophobas morio]KAJ3658732.1 hypothetical protein Zmor_010456 [Zophobas morio]
MANNFPTKEQAVVITAVDTLNLQDYIVAIGNVVTPKNILFASRISKNRICIYLTSKSLVDDLVTVHPCIKVKDVDVGIRRLLNPARRLILSNVCPSIPHVIFENRIKSLGLVPVSPMSFMRAGIKDEQYAHILSFRRYMYVQPDDSIILPDSLVLKYDDTNYRVFLTYDDVCYKCKSTGHYANECPNVTSSNQDPNPTVSIEETPRKRQIDDDVSSPEISPLDLSGDTSSKINNTLKKKKTSDSCDSLTPTLDLLLPAQDLLNNTEQYPLNFDQVVGFLDKASGVNDILSLLREYTNDIQGVMNLLYDVYPIVNNKSMKNRCRKILRKIKKAYNPDNLNLIDLTSVTRELGMEVDLSHSSK